jgi:DNA-binding HxlR family transcriptional regulator
VTAGWDHIDDDQCRFFQASVELIGRRWSSAILMAVARGARRFSEILASVPGLSDRMLAQRLKELSSAGILAREVVPTMPVQVIYQLTPRGSELMASLQPLVQWGLRWHGPAENGQRKTARRNRSAGSAKRAAPYASGHLIIQSMCRYQPPGSPSNPPPSNPPPSKPPSP